jgi:hypothetical protein
MQSNLLILRCKGTLSGSLQTDCQSCTGGAFTPSAVRGDPQLADVIARVAALETRTVAKSNSFPSFAVVILDHSVLAVCSVAL